VALWWGSISLQSVSDNATILAATQNRMATVKSRYSVVATSIHTGSHLRLWDLNSDGKLTEHKTRLNWLCVADVLGTSSPHVLG